MALYKKAILTNYAIELIAKTIAGNKLEFTKIAVGDGEYAETVDLKSMNNLNNERQSAKITSVQAVNKKIARVRGVITNENLRQNYYIREVGLFAKDPDRGEILYSYAQTEIADLMPAHNSRLPCSKTIDMLTAVNDTEDIIVNYNPSDIVSKEDLEEFLTNLSNIVIIPKEESIPVEQRKENTYYLKIIDGIVVNVPKYIRVSPNMGLKPIDEEDWWL